MSIRYEKDLARDFQGNIDSRQALQAGIFGVVPTRMLAKRLMQLSKEIARVHTSPIDMSIVELEENMAHVEDEFEIAAELRKRNRRKVARARNSFPYHLKHVPGLRVDMEPESPEEIRG